MISETTDAFPAWRSFPLLKYLYRVYSDPKLVVRIFFQAFGNSNIYQVAYLDGFELMIF